MEGLEYGYTIFELLADINVSSNKSTPVSSVTVTIIETNNHRSVMVDHDENIEIQLLLIPVKVEAALSVGTCIHLTVATQTMHDPV